MGTKVAEKKENNVVEFDISMMEADAGVGVANMGQDDLALPFLKILSGLDPLLDELEEAKRGDLYNTVSGQGWGYLNSLCLPKAFYPMGT